MRYFPDFLCLLLALGLGLFSGQAFAASASGYTGYDQGPPISVAPSAQNPPVQLPPQLPAFLPNGAINLDEAWIQNGGARLYWNTLLIPRQIKMSGATWIDPALTPQLFPPRPEPVRKRTYVRRKAESKPAATANVPQGASSATLMPPSSGAIPLPLTVSGATAPSSPQTPTEPAKASPSLPTNPSNPKTAAVPSPLAPLPASSSK